MPTRSSGISRSKTFRAPATRSPPLYGSSGGNDGFVSLEVSPLLAHDTAGTIAMVKELWKRVDRPNVMIKIPGTKEGLPAIEESIYRGYNINVTLIFSVEMYEKAALRLRQGLAAPRRRGKTDRQDPLGQLASSSAESTRPSTSCCKSASPRAKSSIICSARPASPA